VGVAALGVLFLLNLQLSTWALGPVQRAWSQQQQFIADASHELKTPLTVILANNAILRQRGRETVASQGQWIESTQMEAERMQALVTDMLDLARPAAIASAEQPAPALDFSRLVEGEALTFEAVAFERNLVWKAAVAEGVSVRGNASRLQRLVAVLLDNACKYTDEGGTVEVALRTEGAEAVLSVRNSGEPIAKEDLPHLFDRFYRADKARTQAGAQAAAPEGYGLGLAIAADIAQAHKGALTVSSTAEEGTVFTLRLPLA
jgi:signal transduction histidine kinase